MTGHLEGTPYHFRISLTSSRPHQVIREGLPTTPGHPGLLPDHSRTSGRASRPLPDICKGLPPLPDIAEGLPTTPGYSEGLPTTFGHPGMTPNHSQIFVRVSHHSRTYRRVFQPLPDIMDGLPTTPRHPGRPPDNSQTSWKAS